MDTNDWLILTGILTAAFTGVAIIQRIIERRRPRIKLLIVDKTVSEKNRINCLIAAINIGDGDAFNARLTASAGDNESLPTNFAARLSNDNRLEFWAVIPARVTKPHMDEETGVMVGDLWDKPIPDTNDFATVTWNQPPYLFWTHRKKIRLSEIEEA